MGNIAISRRGWHKGPVHPHACGEHRQPRARAPDASGSSPRLWGTWDEKEVRPARDRFIPTPVGNIQQGICFPRSQTVHPHACGEHFRVRNRTSIFPGSSPRLWGTYRQGDHVERVRRFIPTPVGNIQHRSHFQLPRPVHPHACGEHASPPRPANLPSGSSPRLWGTCLGTGTRRTEDRFIPTPVGNMSASTNASMVVAVHPHACGEHQTRPRFRNRLFGSSPRLWGTYLRSTAWSFSFRFIPTPVGNIRHWTRSGGLKTVHPHACGEHPNIFPNKESPTTISCIFENSEIC